MSPLYSIVHYTRNDRARVFAFLERVHSPQQSERLKRQWDWKYDANPFNPGDTPELVLMQDRDEIIGLCGVIPLRVAVHGKEYPMVHPCDLVLAPMYRGRRLSERLINSYMHKNRMGFGWLNPASMRRTTNLLGASAKQLTPLVRILQPLALAQQLLPRKFCEHAPPAAAGEGIFSRAYNQSNIARVSRFDARFDALWERARGEHLVIGVRDARFLNWRFAERPDVEYIHLCARRGAQVDGYIVLRVDAKRRVRIGYIVDMFGEDASLDLLFDAAIRYFKSQKTHVLFGQFTAGAYRRKFYRRGFLPLLWHKRPYVYARVERREPELQVFGEVNRWFLTMADGDMEMSL